MRTFKSAQKSAFANKSAKKSTLKSTFGSSEPICILYYDQRRPFVSSSARRLKQVDSVARLGAIQVNPVETLQGETREVRAVEKALEVNDGIELNVVDSGVAGKSASAALLPSPACTKCSDILCFVFRLMLKGTLQINSNS